MYPSASTVLLIGVLAAAGPAAAFDCRHAVGAGEAQSVLVTRARKIFDTLCGNALGGPAAVTFSVAPDYRKPNASVSSSYVITVTHALLDLANKKPDAFDATIAFVIGHELAHANLGHFWLETYLQGSAGDPRMQLPALTTDARAAEMEADIKGAILALSAGYSMRVVSESGVLNQISKVLDPEGKSTTHLPGARREEDLAKLHAEVALDVEWLRFARLAFALGNRDSAVAALEAFLKKYPHAREVQAWLAHADYLEGLAQLNAATDAGASWRDILSPTPAPSGARDESPRLRLGPAACAPVLPSLSAIEVSVDPPKVIRGTPSARRVQESLKLARAAMLKAHRKFESLAVDGSFPDHMLAASGCARALSPVEGTVDGERLSQARASILATNSWEAARTTKEACELWGTAVAKAPPSAAIQTLLNAEIVAMLRDVREGNRWWTNRKSTLACLARHLPYAAQVSDYLERASQQAAPSPTSIVSQERPLDRSRSYQNLTKTVLTSKPPRPVGQPSHGFLENTELSAVTLVGDGRCFSFRADGSRPVELCTFDLPAPTKYPMDDVVRGLRGTWTFFGDGARAFSIEPGPDEEAMVLVGEDEVRRIGRAFEYRRVTEGR